MVQAFVLDKRFFAGRRSRFSPLALLSQVVFDRLVMAYPIDGCVVVFDQMENSIKSTKNDHGEIIKISNQEINPSPFYSKYSHSEVRFEKSSNSKLKISGQYQKINQNKKRPGEPGLLLRSVPKNRYHHSLRG